MGIFDIFRLNSNNIKSLKQKDERKAECPNCSEKLEKIPGAKTKCPHCGKYMFVRTRPKDNIRVVVTEIEADRIDEEWSIINNVHSSFIAKKEIYAKEQLPWKRGEKTIVNEFLEATYQCEISEEELYQRRQKSININNAIWSLCNQYLLKNQKECNFDNIISLYLVLERIRVSEDKNANTIVRKRMHFELLRLKESGMSIVIPVSSYNSCNACKKLNGKEFNIDEVIKNQPFPPKDCRCLRCSLSL